MKLSYLWNILVGSFLFGFIALVLLIGFLIYSTFSTRKEFPYKASKVENAIALLRIEGVLSNTEEFVRTIKDIQENPTIQGILVRINSPGGLVAPSQELYREILKYRTQTGKPVVASLDTIATSGGYYVASACSKIIANPGSLTASIGVKMNFANLEELYQWLRVKPFALTSGKFKDIGATYRNMTPDEKQLLTSLIENIYDQFIKDILNSRGPILLEKDLRSIADGRIMSGEQALRVKLVDELGGFEDALEIIAKLAHIKGKPQLIEPSEKGKNILEYVLEGKWAQKILTKIFISNSPLVEWSY
ncbi:MAG: signal peptide peptidase SppA [Deltaproteobacteria bacterium]|nr:signal peptide peptidase SppA [Deltaproteobacteria bacterium]